MRRTFNDCWEFAEMPLDTPVEQVPAGAWKSVGIPHDFLITDSSALYRDATGWYRKRFSLKDLGIDPGRRIFINFDGVYMDSRVWLNGALIGEWKYGYSSFTMELTGHILNDDSNELLVSVRHQSPNSRWYSGAGIFRDVTLIDKGHAFIPENGVYFSAEETQECSDCFEITTRTEIDGIHADKATVKHTLIDDLGTQIRLEPVFEAELTAERPFVQDGKKAGLLRGITGGRRRNRIRVVEKRYRVSGIRRWDVEYPMLYTLKTEICCDTEVEDTEEMKVGFRTVKADPDRGFFLNGRRLKLNGVCEHHDLGALGSAFNRTAFKRKLRILSDMGVNAIRLTHNMAARGVLELADEEGFMVISEAFDMWERPKTDYDYARFFREWHARDVESWVRRDRNHPCVIFWSIGNEIYDTHADERGQEITAELKRLVEKFDPMKNARVTSGSNYMPWEGAQKCAEILKIAGYNYAEKCYEKHHKEHPDWVIYGSETSSIVMSRGVYHFPLSAETLAEEDEQCSALGNSCTSWGARSFEECAGFDRDTEFSMGQFLWSGFDYIGEPTPYHTKNSYFGQIDTAGFPKDMFYFWKSVWTSTADDPMIHIIPSYWDFNEGQMIDIRVVSNLDDVELFLNGQSLGRKKLTHAPSSGHTLFADYRAAYEPGELTAVAFYENREEAARDCIRSFGETAAYKVDQEPFDEDDDILFYDISAVDKDGNPVGNAVDRVKVRVVGGELIGLDNGDSTDQENYASDSRRLFGGRLLAVVKPDEGADLQGVNVFVARDEREIPVRKLEIEAIDGTLFTEDRKVLRAGVRILPENATDREVSFRAVNNTGVISNLVKLGDVRREADGSDSVELTAMGDGEFRLRAVSASGTSGTRIISELEYKIEGVGTAYLDPFGFIAGSLYSSAIGEVGPGNEKGVSSARDGRTVITWDNLDFGRDLADSITIPIFTLDGDEYPIQVWRGVPGEDDARILVDSEYHKPSIWNTYQEETYRLSEYLTGIQKISIVVDRKFHIKGFIFGRIKRAFADHSAASADNIYGDQFRTGTDAVYDIGNNVTLVFEDMDFGEEGASSIVINGRGAQSNSVHVVFDGTDGEEIKQLVEFPAESAFTEHRFLLRTAPDGVIRGRQTVSFVFLPGTMFDLRSFRFE